MSDDSDYDAEQDEEIDIYKRKYQLLAERCEVLQQVCLINYFVIIILSTIFS